MGRRVLGGDLTDAFTHYPVHKRRVGLSPAGASAERQPGFPQPWGSKLPGARATEEWSSRAWKEGVLFQSIPEKMRKEMLEKLGAWQRG